MNTVLVLVFFFVNHKIENINTSELRIGNLVSLDGEIIKCLGVGLTYISIQKDIDGISQSFQDIIIEDFEPIQFDKIWKIKAGFCQEDHDLWYFPENERITLIGNELFIGATFIKKISFIHEIQNLYFDFVGVDLEFQD